MAVFITQWRDKQLLFIFSFFILAAVFLVTDGHSAALRGVLDALRPFYQHW